jgi:two-component system, LuxR family, sensor kinase FixL
VNSSDPAALSLRSGEDMLRLVKSAVEHFSYSVVITTAELNSPGPRIVYVTPAFCRMTGFTPEEIIGKTPRILQGPNTERTVLAKLRRHLSEGKSYSCELINYRKDRSEYLVHLTIDPVLDADGKITHWVAVQQDVTERRRAEEMLAQADRLAAIGAAMAGLSHESRNALQRMQASLDVLAEMSANQPDFMEQINNIRHSQDDLFQLYEEVREFAAPVRLDPQTSYVDNIVHDTWATLAIKREGRSIRFRELPCNVDLQCDVDQFAMRQVFRNILENSLAACPDPVEIEVSFAEAITDDEPALCVRIRDNGPGLNEEQQRRIFDEFYTTKPHGTGLGMAIVRRLVQAHGGRVEVGTQSRVGAEVIVTLPRRASQSNPSLDG